MKKVLAVADGCESLDHEKLSEDEKFAIGYLAGVPSKSKYEDGKLTMTTEPCAIVDVDGKWQVFKKVSTVG